jgi:hypothetical protein
VIYQAVGYRRVGARRGTRFVPGKRGDRTASFNVAAAQADWLAQEHPDLIWNVETLGASQQVRSGRLRA